MLTSTKPERYTGYCSKLNMTHLECGGRCGRPDWHHCDSTHPDDEDIHCFEVIGHHGKCFAPNGPVWDKPEEKQDDEPVPKYWRARPGKMKRPEDETTLKVFFQPGDDEDE